jgi:hypothetical protein
VPLIEQIDQLRAEQVLFVRAFERLGMRISAIVDAGFSVIADGVSA